MFARLDTLGRPCEAWREIFSSEHPTDNPTCVGWLPDRGHSASEHGRDRRPSPERPSQPRSIAGEVRHPDGTKRDRQGSGEPAESSRARPPTSSAHSRNPRRTPRRNSASPQMQRSSTGGPLEKRASTPHPRPHPNLALLTSPAEEERWVIAAMKSSVARALLPRGPTLAFCVPRRRG